MISLCTHRLSLTAIAAFCSLAGLATPGTGFASPANALSGERSDLAQQVLIRRTRHGVPHIYADNVRAAGYGLGYAQMEDHGGRVIESLIRGRGEWAMFVEHEDDKRAIAIDEDAERRLRHRRALDTWPELETDTREFLSGYAAGVNRYIEIHSDEFIDLGPLSFTGQDVHARNIVAPSRQSVRRFMEALAAERQNTVTGEVLARLAAHEREPHPDTGSNAWAIAPGRTKSGRAILLRNPHLSWDAGYYEAQLIVPGILNFYGDFRVGDALGIIGGFNRHLGWATTNNAPDLDEIYALDADPDQANHYLLDGKSIALIQQLLTVEYRHGNALGTEVREFWSTPQGPVIHREGGRIYILKAAGDGEFRTGEQFFRMMKARNIDEWTAAMKMRARISSNLSYADAEGNIFYVWNASMPDRPHPPVDDGEAIPVSRSSDMWQKLLPWDALPKLLNPPGGYLHNENDSFHYTNLNSILDAADYPAYFPEPVLRLRSQHALELLHNDQKFSLEDVVAMKHSMRMLLAARVKGDLLQAVAATGPRGETADALQLLREWDNTAARDSRGSVLFKTWWDRYVATADADADDIKPTPASVGYGATAERLFRNPWSVERPVDTPFGLADFERAATSFLWAIEEANKRYGGWNRNWGEVHRAVIDDADVAVGGCTGLLGCFRVLWFDEQPDEDGRLTVQGGDGWVLAVEFGETPRAYSVLAYGESSNIHSPYNSDQLAEFANNEMAPVAYTDEDVSRDTRREYRPGFVLK